MVPSLARRGAFVLATAATFLLVGALHAAAPLVALGGLVLAALMTAYLQYFPAAILLRRRKIEVSWWVPPGEQAGGALSVERPFALHLALRNHGLRRLRVLSIEIFGSRALELPGGLEAVVPAGRQVELSCELRARAAGYQVIHGAVLTFGDALGLFEVRAYFPNPIAVKVFPREATDREVAALRPRGAPIDQRVGRHLLRRRGLHGELRELREHGHGDPFKLIAWKATARRGKLMVRDLETEIVGTHQILLDIGGAMRGGAPGRSKLDYALELASGLARGALAGGDRVGLITFDSRIYSELRPDEGRQHMLELTDRLLETQHVVDEDLTDLTAGELVGAIAAYLANQEAVDVRVGRAPPLDHPAWQRIQAGPNGELYDLDALGNIVGTLLDAMDEAQGDKSLAPAWWWQRVQISPDSDPLTAKLRLFARLRGLELPYRREHERGRRAAGLAEAIRRAGRARLDSMVILSDLGGVAEAPSEVIAALGRARRAGCKIIAVAPSEARLVQAPATETARRVLAAIRDDEDARLDDARHLLASAGVRVVEGGRAAALAS